MHHLNQKIDDGDLSAEVIRDHYREEALLSMAEKSKYSGPELPIPDSPEEKDKLIRWLRRGVWQAESSSSWYRLKWEDAEESLDALLRENRQVREDRDQLAAEVQGLKDEADRRIDPAQHQLVRDRVTDLEQRLAYAEATIETMLLS